jgi:hypothetical protein
MNTLPSCTRKAALRFAFLAIALTLAGCKTTPPVDWDSRVGTFTFDQAVAELGVPDRTAKLSDGSTIAEWVKPSSGGFTLGVGTSSYGSHGAVGVGQTFSSGYGERVLRLVFNPENKLASWSKNY